MEFRNEQLTQFLAFLGEEETLLDLEYIGNRQEDLKDMVNDKIMESLFGLFKTGYGSIIGFWHTKASMEEAPIFWLDSEGSPVSIIADSLFDFFSLLPLRTGTIYDLTAGIETEELYPNPRRLPTEEISKEDIQEYIDYSNDNFEDFSSFEAWCQTNQISTSKTPLALIKNARKENNDFRNWLIDNGIEL